MDGEMKAVSRRDLLVAGAGVALGATSIASAAETVKPFRVAHLTDMHVQPERRAGEGYLAALASLETLDPKPDLIVTGGDHVFDSTEQELARTRVQWDLYTKTIAQTKFPVRAVLGNHDIFGWGNAKVPDSTAGYGRAMAMDQLQLAKTYYAFDAGGWRFIILDSMTRRGSSYLGELGPEQTEWLKAELKSAAGGNVIVFSHIPILGVCVFFDGADRLGEKGWNVPDAWMHRDMRELLDLFDESNVKIAASGHIHLVDRADYRGIAFLCDGAVSGNWWKGPRLQFPEGYALIDLYPDGRFEHQYKTYGWHAEPGPSAP